MSAGGGGPNIADELFRQQNMRAKGDAGGDGANEKSIFDFLMDAIATKGPAWLTKLTGAPNLEQAGQHSMLKPIEPQGSWLDKPINAMAASFSAQGGFLARLAGVLMKNRGEIGPAEGTGDALAHHHGDSGTGSGSADTGSFESGGQALAGGGFDFNASFQQLGDFGGSAIEYGGKLLSAGVSYDEGGPPIRLSDLGSLTASATPVTAERGGAGMDVG